MASVGAHYWQALAGIAFFGAVGWGVAVLVLPRRFSGLVRLALFYLLGVAFVGEALYVASHVLGVPIRRTSILVLAGLPILAGFVVTVRRRKDRCPRLPRASGGWPFVVAACLAAVVSVGLFADAVTNPVTDWDGLMTWSPQARFVQGARSVDAPVLRDARWFVTNREYPLLLPLMQVTVRELCDVNDDRVIRPLYAAFFPCLLALVWEFVRRSGRFAGAIVVGLTSLAPQLTFQNAGGPSGAYSDFPLACLLGAGLLLLVRGGRALSVGVGAGVLLGAVVLAKSEGLLLAAFVIGVMLAASMLRLRRRALPLRRWWLAVRSPVVAGLGVLLAAGLLASWRASIPVSAYATLLRPVFDQDARSVFLGHLVSALPVMASAMGVAHWGWFWFLWLVVLVAGWRGLRGWPVALLAAVVAATAIGPLAAYGAALFPPELARTTWDRFLVQGSVAWLALFGVALGAVFGGSLLARRVVGGCACLVMCAGLPGTFRGVRSGVEDLWAYRSESQRAMEGRVKGGEYVAGIEAIRRAIPEDGSYLLLKRDVAPGLQNLVRYDLAPRRAWFLGSIAESRRVLEVGWRPGAPDAAVVTRGLRERPVIEDRLELATEYPEYFLGTEDPGIPLGFDSPPEGGELRGRLIVAGWCQEAPGVSCDPMSLWVDGEPRAPIRVRRFARPDVAAVLPALGDCAGAGFEAEFRMDERDLGPRTLTLFVRARHDRYRRQERHVTIVR